jgi:hypothetical protein
VLVGVAEILFEYYSNNTVTPKHVKLSGKPIEKLTKIKFND